MKKLVEKLEQRDKLKTPDEKEKDIVCADLDAIFTAHGLDKEKDNKQLYTELLEWKRHKY